MTSSLRKTAGGLFLSVLSFAALQGCGGGSGDDDSGLKKLLCGSPLAKGILTVGLNVLATELALGELQQQGILAENVSSDDGVKTLLNTALEKVVDPKVLSVSSVTSAFEGDSVKVLKLGGTFAPAFGIASGLLKKAVGVGDSSAQGSESSNLFKFVLEGYKVVAARHFFDFDQFEDFQKMTAPSVSFLASTAQPNAQQWHLKQTRFDDAVKILNNTTKEVKVAVIDTGVDSEHPDLKDVMLPGYNAIDGSSNTNDKNGHGTHCAGIIAAQGNSGTKAALGVAARGNVKIVPIKVLGDDGSGSSEAIDKGIRWAVEKAKVDVISMSLGGGLEYTDVKKAGGLDNPILKEAIAKGVIVIVAAGNENCPLGGKCELPGFLTSTSFKEYTVVPCAYEGTLCVGATDPDETLAEYSNFSSGKSSGFRTKADVNAPGTKIYSTWPRDKGSYKAISGTSMATPYVAGVAALLKANAPEGTAVNQEFVRNALSKGLVSEDSAKKKSGTGRVDLYATAYEFSKSTLQKTPSTGEPSLKPEPQKGVPSDKGSGGEGGAFSSVWDLLCAL
jgi:subtilisin family serine protease